ncbi:MAG TPA: lycopene beta-cyclase CrtY [Caulobacteraceae bacterium]|nr:lycopene beta-cyclase CrtY [Caulobacteraceae bacterium]
MRSSTTSADVVIAGGGLSGSLIALRLKALRPALRVLLLEREATIGGEHTWCHFATDVSPDIGVWLNPLVAHEWPGYEVRFPGHGRRLSTPYRAVTSARLHEVVTRAMGPEAWLGVDVATVSPDRVTTADGRSAVAPLIIDARGPAPSADLMLAWQKFVGREVRVAAPHGLTRPILMDATVPQIDGYRFLYVLPLSADRLLIEDTRYSDAARLDAGAISREIDAYATARGWEIAAICRTESGVLPIALAGDIDAFWRRAQGGGVPVGLRAALFHPTTGYSLPDAARLADAIAAAPALTTAAIAGLVSETTKHLWQSRAYWRLLNRMTFRACDPARRYRVFERFYRLPQPLIERFYAGRSGLGDKLRILAGKPPVPVGRAIACLPERSAAAQMSPA